MAGRNGRWLVGLVGLVNGWYFWVEADAGRKSGNTRKKDIVVGHLGWSRNISITNIVE